MEYIKTGFVNFKKCSLLENRVLIGIDLGTSLSKFIFLNKQNEHLLHDDNVDHIILQYSTFRKEDTPKALEWLKENAYIQEGIKFGIHCTGIESLQTKKHVESIFGLKFVNVREGLALVAGHKIALEQCSIENLIHTPVNIDEPGEIDNELLKKMFTRLKKQITTNDNTNKVSSLFPFVLGYWDSQTSIFYYEENGLAKQVGLFENGEKSFLGIAKCLTDCNDYDEIIVSASKGNRKNTDTLIKDILIDFQKSPFGKVSPELPLFSFGKCAENNLELQYSKEDLAMSLLCLECSKISYSCRQVCFIKKTKKVYLSGKTFKSSLFRKEILEKSRRRPIGIEYTFLDLEYATALGAMFCIYEDKEMYLK